ncbi:Hypothetical protein FKW44_021629 [Caligus rogercresseyi]|uniref:Uncharacterized protein n=1 Tax=Caligus rogercresseyi TaxID=217165 RepID=A0A7T8GNY1_CALRO|nr:Hypothetical protein FKW44_023178 [Caligus rogercresseyi]QQP36500.1 Hypothetical protein FKW44_021629 [Caligus rogercresseyi]
MNKEFISLVMGRYNDKTRKKENMLELLPTPLYKKKRGLKDLHHNPPIYHIRSCTNYSDQHHRNRPFNSIRDLRQQGNYTNEPADIRLNGDSDEDDIFSFERRRQ